MSQNQEEEPVKMNQHETFVLIEVWKQLKEEGIIDNHQKNSLICARVKEEMAARDITKHCPVKMHRRTQAPRGKYNKVTMPTVSLAMEGPLLFTLMPLISSRVLVL